MERAGALWAVADARRCRLSFDDLLGVCTLVGGTHELDAVEELVTSLLVQATVALHGSSQASTPASHGWFLEAYAERVRERLGDLGLVGLGPVTGRLEQGTTPSEIDARVAGRAAADRAQLDVRRRVERGSRGHRD
ncbi:hypothetical protein LRP67_03645 [Nocardioides sp. cx-169]|uniref:hypothetical protein n=1 Tax=Nocardioides sp. cx-169 TaxID=2899080 RepID=UPI001E38E770|nr:hypothetical protein [Nocardioides sp. cx-169]MCD4533172.1 hypothetical protein [Nocardioides sp. cx-169]